MANKKSVEAPAYGGDGSVEPGPYSPLNTDNPAMMPAGGPPAAHFAGAGASLEAVRDDVGTFDGGRFRISHRDCNTVLTVQLGDAGSILAKPGIMIAMSPQVKLKGALRFNFKKFIGGGDIASSTYTGPGEVMLAPTYLGDVTALRLSGPETWSVGKDAFLATSVTITKDLKSQSLGKAIFSGEGLFVYKMRGVGIIWLASFGAIVRKDLVEGEDYIVDNGHLVAWNCGYRLERVSAGGIISNLSSAEGIVCRFTGPGTVFLQTRNAHAFAHWTAAHAPR